ncbi:MAG: serpin family protein [Cyclobacteriaceae bacterium]|nr:serpin family protein [Cyclobacteriaceae bacterium]
MKKTLIYFVGLVFLSSCYTEEINGPVSLRELTAEEEEVVLSNNDFAIGILQKIDSAEQQNYFISPLSISYALGMTYNGAGGTTKEAMAATLGCQDLSPETINQGYKDLKGLLADADPKVTMDIANSIWYRQELNIKGTFNDLVTTYFDAHVSPLNFNDPGAKDIINQWVADNTNDKIQNMLGQIPPEAVMYLVNAIYFNADWKYKFEKNQTSPGDFFNEDGTISEARFMVSEGVELLKYYPPGLTMVDIPYSNGQYAMTVLMPDKSSSTKTIIENLTAHQLNEWYLNADTSAVKLFLPKFKIEYKTSLNDALKALGMGLAFSDGADFSGLFEEVLPLAITKVAHQTFINVDETGTEAAAATSVEVGITSMPSGPPVVRIDRSFIFLIRERHTNTIVFAGKMLAP